jgi:hypothetical protein
MASAPRWKPIDDYVGPVSKRIAGVPSLLEEGLYRGRLRGGQYSAVLSSSDVYKRSVAERYPRGFDLQSNWKFQLILAKFTKRDLETTIYGASSLLVQHIVRHSNS